jgi:hypothetical protein
MANPHAALLALLTKDVAFDTNPQGKPPITIPRYRAAIHAVLAVRPPTLARPDDDVTPRAIRDAYDAGARAALSAALEALASALTQRTTP